MAEPLATVDELATFMGAPDAWDTEIGRASCRERVFITV